MKNKLSKGLSLSLSVNPKHSISERFKASTRGFCHFWKKFKGKWNTPFSVILGLAPRIHAEHYHLLDTRDTPEYDRDLMVDSRVKPENDHNNLLPQCAPDATGFLSDVYKRGTRARKFLVDGVQCGRSMIEMLGVLAIIGVLSVGGIAGYSKAMEKFKINKTIEQMSMILANTRILYSSQGNYSGLYGSGTYIEGIKPIIGETDEFLSPFGGYNWLETGSSHNDMFHLTFSALPKEACMELATLNWGTEQSSGIVGLGIGIDYISWPAFDYYDDCINSSTSEHITSSGILYTACKTKLPIPPATAANYCNICAEAGNCGITLFSK